MSESTSKSKVYITALIPAAGIGNRMKINYPKQYLQIAGKTIIEHTISALLKQSRISKIVVVLNKNDIIFQQLMIAKNSKIKTVTGGSTRANSVLAGITYLSDNLQLDPCWVLIHDAARPCLHQIDLRKIISFIDNKQSFCGGILAVPVRDTIKRSIKGKMNISYTIKRNALWHALTPQFFPLALIKNCLTRILKQNTAITDDASALEYCGYYPQLLKGRIDNLKITQPEDLMLAEFYLSRTLQDNN